MAVQFPWENAPKSGKGFRLNEVRLRAGRVSVSVACLFWYENVGHLGFWDFRDSNVRTLSPITFEDGLPLTLNYFHMKAWLFADLGKKTASKSEAIFLAAVGLFWTPLICFDTKMSAILDLEIWFQRFKSLQP